MIDGIIQSLRCCINHCEKPRALNRRYCHKHCVERLKEITAPAKVICFCCRDYL